MKKYKILINGKEFIAEIEILDESETSKNISLTTESLSSENETKNYPLKDKYQPDSGAKNFPGQKKIMTSPINGIVERIITKRGNFVNENDVLFIFEAMKMKTNISSPYTGVVDEILVEFGETVQSGQEILVFK